LPAAVAAVPVAAIAVGLERVEVLLLRPSWPQAVSALLDWFTDPHPPYLQELGLTIILPTGC
jgi:hypothetical protein